jgi:hypothetical protein
MFLLCKHPWAQSLASHLRILPHKDSSLPKRNSGPVKMINSHPQDLCEMRHILGRSFPAWKYWDAMDYICFYFTEWKYFILHVNFLKHTNHK